MNKDEHRDLHDKTGTDFLLELWLILETFSSNTGKTCPGQRPKCSGLHICKFYLLSGKCSFAKKCTFGHSLGINHNANILKENFLDHLSVEDLRYHFTKPENRTSVTTPKICKFYNNPDGCEKLKGERKGNCQNLHICRNYILNTCPDPTRSNHNHDVTKRDIVDILQKYGINTDRRWWDVIEELRSITLKVERESTDGPGTLQRNFSDTNIRDDISRPYIRAPAMKAGQHVANDHTSNKMVCIYYLRGKCAFGGSCWNYHGSLPYQWFCKRIGGNGMELLPLKISDNVEMELNYSNPAVTTWYIQLDDQSLKVDIESMSAFSIFGNQYDISRLSTASSVELEHVTMTTQWIWYWKDDQGVWNEYGQGAADEYRSDKTSYNLEQAFLSNDHGQFKFATSGFEYFLDFDTMTQRNLHSGTQRNVCRRPKFVSPEEFQQWKLRPKAKCGPGHPRGASAGKQNTIRLPTHWLVPKGIDPLDHVQTVEIREAHPEFEEIERLFHQTMPTNSKIKSIERIENGELWDNYVSNKARVTKKRNGTAVDEKRLFHGTKNKYIDAICKQGFDFRLSGTSSGTLFGKGSYFATESKYSSCYTDVQDKAMFVAKVLVGEYVIGDPRYTRPPNKDVSNPCSDLYDSCVDNEDDPKIFVIFDSRQVYPEYIIRYE